MKTYLLAKGEPFKIISDIGSGINYTKSGLKELINQVNSNKVSKIVILYKDRLIRFGYEMIEYFAKLNSCEIEVIDNTEKTEEQELVEDLIEIVTVFSCRLQGKRANKAKKLVKELLENDKNNKS
jgi:putative resolvase